MMKMSRQIQDIQARSWQMSFNDLLTILLVFFILLISVSQFQMDKVQDLSSTAVQTFGDHRPQTASPEWIGSLNVIDGLRVNPVEGGVELVLPASLVYDSGSAEILYTDLLRELGARLRNEAGAIRVEGHTDNIPIATDLFPSNWELSVLRAANVARFLTEECGIGPETVSTAGYADSRPLADNGSPEGRALNRRVNMVISLK